MKGEGIRWLLFGLGFGWRGRLAHNAALGRGDTLTLALSREGRGDPLASLGAWFRVAVLVGLWIPAFAGMMGG